MPLGDRKVNFGNILPIATNKILWPLTTIYQNAFYKEIQQCSKAIYHIHIPKTGGTTINHAFLSLGGQSDISKLYANLSKQPNNRLIVNSKVFVGWNKQLINDGKYTYAFSHWPIHSLNLPKHIFKFTCLRDPLKRLLSYYNMLRFYQLNKIQHGLFTPLYRNFEHFLDKESPEEISAQLFMFSENFNSVEAIENVLKCDNFFFTENIVDGMNSLAKRLNISLPISHQKNYGYSESIPDLQLYRAKQLLSEEYKMIDFLRKMKQNGRPN